MARKGSKPVSLQSEPKRGAVLAFDYGERRIGVAVGELELGIAHPLETIDSRSRAERFSSIEALVDEWQPVLFVVGLPVNTDGSVHSLTPMVRKFCNVLKHKFGIDSQLLDERYTSSEAASILRDAGVRGRRQKSYLDQVAAQTILEDFFTQGEQRAHDDHAA